ncbi:MAG: response regulator, partial [Leptospiraceae bacterium]|nr:response regulator [Leptospiraceae bacterium]
STIQLLGQSTFDLVLLDLGLPDGDGRSVSRWMRAHGIDTPVVALTAAAFEEEKESAFAAGMNGFLTKPITQDILQQALAEFLPGGDGRARQ